MPQRRTAGGAKTGQAGGTSLGKSLQNDRKKRSEAPVVHRAERATGVGESVAHRSVLEQSSLDDFIAQAFMSQANFEPDRYGPRYVEEGATLVSLVDEDTPEIICAKQRRAASLIVPIPWRPPFAEGDTAEDLVQTEGEAFLEWRRGLARVEEQEGLVMTPYERNLDFWRQLWRCIERSDVIVQILDSRDPLFYRSKDLERYIRTRFPQKRHLLLINKSDFLSPELRQRWAEHLAAEAAGTDVLFFSALRELHRQQRVPGGKRENAARHSKDTEAGEPDADPAGDATGSDDGGSEDENEADAGTTGAAAPAGPAVHLPPHGNFEGCDGSDVLDTVQLLEALRSRLGEAPAATKDEAAGGPRRSAGVIGFVGYPNVGKSSVINALFGAKKVSMSRTPGKTKHLQTLDLPGSDVTLCDCPGLVFPSVVATSAHLAINGTVPIVELRESIKPVRLVVMRVGRQRIIEKYALIEAAFLEGNERMDAVMDETRGLLCAMAVVCKRYLRLGVPDETWSAKRILTDYCTGALLHCQEPEATLPLSAAAAAAAPTGGPAAAAPPADDESDFSDVGDFLRGEERSKKCLATRGGGMKGRKQRHS